LLILGIESSCDETAAAVVEDGSRVFSNVVSSQFDVHGKYGGVVPELASREHLRAITAVVRQALDQAGCTYRDLGAVAVTEGPGLVGSLLVGMTYAKAICFAHNLPLVGVNHIEGHIHAVAMEAGSQLEYPALALVVSGGHTHLFEMRADFSFRLLGRTRDDAAGEAYDKVAKLLGYNYPGGPVLDRLAAHGHTKALRLPKAKMKGNTLDFSFSGLKTAVLRWVQANNMEAEIAARRALLHDTPQPSIDQWLTVTPQTTLDLIAAFQRTVIEELLEHCEAAAELIDAQSLVISGGVACNAGLREAARTSRLPYAVFFPTPALSTDNAAMIAAAAYRKASRGDFADMTLKAKASLALAQ
jgi:N6-L-threonylcarbamoyladenine synthase